MRLKRIQAKHIADREILEAIAAYHQSVLTEEPPVGSFRLEGNYPEKVVEEKLIRLYDRGLITYGCNLWRPWLSVEGQALLDALRGSD